MTRRPKTYVAALPLSSLPELQELLSSFCGSTARGNVVMVRLGDAAVSALDELVEAGCSAAVPRLRAVLFSKVARSGGTGRRSRLKICRSFALCGFDSLRIHPPLLNLLII